MPEDHEPSHEESSEDRFKKIRAELEAMKLPDIGEDDLEAKLSAPLTSSKLPDVPEIHELIPKSWESKDRFDSKRKEAEKRQRQDQQDAKGLGVGLSIAYIIIGFPFVGIGIGWLIDLALHTSMIKGLGAVVGATLGVVVALIQINRQNQIK